MNKAKALLDSLMGPSRDLSANEKKGEDFTADKVCKMYLAGLCPDQLLAKSVESFKPCSKIHAQPLRDELAAHPDKEKYMKEYERELLHYCQDIIKEVDREIDNEKKTCRRKETEVKISEKEQPKFQEHEQKLKVNIAMAERLGNEGDVDGAAKAMAEAEASQKFIEDTKKRGLREWPGEDVCAVCGVKYVCGKYDENKTYLRPRDQDVWELEHLESKMHLAYKKVRDKIQEIKDKRAHRTKDEKKGDGDRTDRNQKDRDHDEKKGGGDRADRDRRDRDREDEKKGGGDRGDRDRRDRDRGHRDDGRGGDRDRDRRGYGGGRDHGGGRRRSRSRSRRRR